MTELTTFEKALHLVASVRAALANGVKHYDQDGHLLETDIQVIETLLDGPVVIDDSAVDLKRRTPRH